MRFKTKGYIPVFLVVENQTSGDSLLFRKEGLMYSPRGQSGSTLANPAKPSKSDKTLAVASYIPYYGIMAHVMASKSMAARQNILKSELQSTTLAPHESAHGFVFVPAHWTHATRDPIQLAIPFGRPGSSDVVTIDCTF